MATLIDIVERNACLETETPRRRDPAPITFARTFSAAFLASRARAALGNFAKGELLGIDAMAPKDVDIIQRLHEAIRRSVSDQVRKDRIVRDLQADNRRLRRELAASRARPGAGDTISATPNLGVVSNKEP